MRIDVSELLEKVGNEIDLFVSERVNYPEDHLILTVPVRAHVHLTSTGADSLLLRGEVSTAVEMECGRCLTPFQQGLQFKMEEMYLEKIPARRKANEEFELTEEDFTLPIEADQTVDLTEAVRQNLILGLPMKPLCRKDCEGVLQEGKRAST